MNIDPNALADKLAGGGAAAVILVLLFVITALIRKWVRIPDDNYVPREQYDLVTKNCDDWKAIATDGAATVKDQAGQIARLTDVVEKMVAQQGGAKR